MFRNSFPEDIVGIYKRRIYYLTFPLASLLTFMYAIDVSLNAKDISFYISLGFGIEIALLFLVLLAVPAYLETVEIIFYFSLSAHLLIVTHHAINSIDIVNMASVDILGEKLAGLTTWTIVIFLASFLSLSASKLKALYSFNLFSVAGIAIHSFLNFRVPGDLLFSYIFRWLNLFVGLLVVILLVTSIGRLQRQYAATDALTGILNRHSIYSVLAQEVARASRLKISFSIILFDVDNFKAVNDTYGHTVGDQILVELSEVVGRSIRQIDVFGRWGGEEFLLILPGVDLEGAKQMAERLCVIIGQHHFGMTSHLTASFGIAMFRDDRTLDGILHRADSSMYRAKRNGRNQVAVEIVDEVGGFE